MTEPQDPTEWADISAAETQSAYAWALDDEPDEPPRRLTPRRITAIAVGVSAAIVAISGALAYRHLHVKQPAPVASPAPTVPSANPPTPTPPATAPQTPLPPTTEKNNLPDGDTEFVAKMRDFGVPVNDKDPEWTVMLAHAVCATATDPNSPGRYPPGKHTQNELTKGVMENNPDWTWQQAWRFTTSTIAHYCPDVAGPTQQEIAAMPDDDRYLAILQDRLGITPVNDSLVSAGHKVCDLTGQGWWPDKIIDVMNGPNPVADKQVIIETAISVYCPQYR